MEQRTKSAKGGKQLKDCAIVPKVESDDPDMTDTDLGVRPTFFAPMAWTLCELRRRIIFISASKALLPAVLDALLDAQLDALETLARSLI